MSLRRLARLHGEWTVRPLVADDILEFHAARILLLLKHCGTRNRIDGLTKLAKLDFFVRYPDFFEQALGNEPDGSEQLRMLGESTMVRHHYGPWDHRYYQILAFLEATGLMAVSHDQTGYSLALTAAGLASAEDLTTERPFHALVQHMKNVKKSLGRKSGNALKQLIYRELGREVVDRRLGELI